jgi:hypothetical protein
MIDPVRHPKTARFDMRHARIDAPAYVLWVEAPPSFSGKRIYYEAVKKAPCSEIESPIAASDIEVEIIYSTAIKQAERMDTDNVQKPTLDALKGVAYDDDAQVRHVDTRNGQGTSTQRSARRVLTPQRRPMTSSRFRAKASF